MAKWNFKEGVAKKIAEKLTKQKEVKSLRKKHRASRRTAVKGYKKSKSLSKTARRRSIKAARKFHRVSDKGEVGGWAAVGKYTGKVAAKIKAKTAKKQRKTDRKTAKRTARATKKENKASMKEKKSRSTYRKQDTDFFKRNAKQRGMKLSAYYAKYVK